MRRIVTSLITLVLWASPVSAQTQVVSSLSSLSTAGVIDTNGEAVSMTIPLNLGFGSVGVEVRGTWVGTIQVQCTASRGGGTYVALTLTPRDTSVSVTSVTDNGQWSGSINGCQQIRAIATAWTSGAATVTMSGSYAGGAGGGGGGGGGGAVTQGTSPWIVGGGGTAGTAATAVVTVQGIVAGTNLNVNCAAGCASATSDADDASIASGQTNSNSNALNMGFDGSVWRRLTFYANDATAAGTTFLPVLPGLVETSAPSRTNGRMAGFSFTVGGAARTILTDAAGAAITVATDSTHDSAAGATGPQVMGVSAADGTLPTAVTAASEAVRFAMNLQGVAYTRTLDPCSVAKTSIPFSIATATTTELTAALAGASNYYYICSIDLVTAGANNIALVDDDTDGCGSVTSGLAGGTTAATGWNFAANGGLAKGNGNGTVYKTGGTNRVVCLVTSAAVQVSGSIQVVAHP